MNATNLCPELPSSDERGWFPRPRSSAPSVTTTARPIASHTLRTLSERRKVARPSGPAVMLPRSPACYNKAHIFKTKTFEAAFFKQDWDKMKSLSATISYTPIVPAQDDRWMTGQCRHRVLCNGSGAAEVRCQIHCTCKLPAICSVTSANQTIKLTFPQIQLRKQA